LTPGRVAVAVVETDEGCSHLSTITGSGTQVAAVVIPRQLVASVPEGIRTIVDGTVVRANGRSHLRSVVIATRTGTTKIGCDTLVLALGLVARDGLLRQAPEASVTGVGDVVEPGCSVRAAIASGREAGAGSLRPATQHA
jgi:hypothetical protein